MSVKKGLEILESVKRYVAVSSEDLKLVESEAGNLVLLTDLFRLLDQVVVVPEAVWKDNAIKWERIKNIVGKHCDHCKLYNLYDTCEACDWQELRLVITGGW